MKARLERRDDGTLALRSPCVGLWREAPRLGSLVRAGAPLGRVEVLGRLWPLEAPPGAAGIVVEVWEPNRKRAAVDYDTVLLRLDPEAAGAIGQSTAGPDESAASGLVFRSPMAGRFYRRPAPDKPVFVEAGDVVEPGHAIGLLEVMKTFNRLVLGGELPPRVRIVAVVAEDGADVERGEVLLRLEPA